MIAVKSRHKTTKSYAKKYDLVRGHLHINPMSYAIYGFSRITQTLDTTYSMLKGVKKLLSKLRILGKFTEIIYSSGGRLLLFHPPQFQA